MQRTAIFVCSLSFGLANSSALARPSADAAFNDQKAEIHGKAPLPEATQDSVEDVSAALKDAAKADAAIAKEKLDKNDRAGARVSSYLSKTKSAGAAGFASATSSTQQTVRALLNGPEKLQEIAVEISGEGKARVKVGDRNRPISYNDLSLLKQVGSSEQSGSGAETLKLDRKIVAALLIQSEGRDLEAFANDPASNLLATYQGLSGQVLAPATEKIEDSAPVSVARTNASTYTAAAQEALGVRHGNNIDASQSPLSAASAPPELREPIRTTFDSFAKANMRGEAEASTLPKLSALVGNEAFQKYAKSVMDPQDLKTLNYTTAGAMIAASGNVTPAQMQIANAIIALETGIDVNGGANRKDGWMDLAQYVGSNASLNDAQLKSKDRALFRRGQIILKDYETELRSLQGLDLLASIQYPFTLDLTDAVAGKTRELESALALLVRTSNKDKSTLAQRKRLSAHAGDVLASLKSASTLEQKHQAIRRLFANDAIRESWRKLEPGIYQTARRAAAYLVYARATEDLKDWLHPLSYLARATFELQRERAKMPAKVQRAIASDAPAKVSAPAPSGRLDF